MRNSRLTGIVHKRALVTRVLDRIGALTVDDVPCNLTKDYILSMEPMLQYCIKLDWSQQPSLPSVCTMEDIPTICQEMMKAETPGGKSRKIHDSLMFHVVLPILIHMYCKEIICLSDVGECHCMHVVSLLQLYVNQARL